jgi:pimeloyl-ACP methyl ester carboxylesterase
LTVTFFEQDGRIVGDFVAIVTGREIRGRYQRVRLDGDQVSFETAGAASVCEGRLEDGEIRATYRNNRGSKGTCRLTRTGEIASAPSLAAGPHRRSDPRLRRFAFASKALAGNLLGDPGELRGAIYLPPSYLVSPERRFPVVYLLHGIADDCTVWSEAWNLPAILDELAHSRRASETIVVMPDGRNRWMGSFYVNSSVTGRWEDALATELVAFVDRELRTVARSDARAVVGHSMGGFGAITLGMRHPDVFGVVYAISPCCLAPVEDMSWGNPAWHAALKFRSKEDVDAALERREFYPVAMIAFQAALMGDPSRAVPAVLPVREERGELLPAEPAFTEWQERFPIRLVRRQREALLRLKLLVLEYGIGDQFAHIPVATASFSAVLSELRVPHRLDVHSGDHRNRMAERLASHVWPAVSGALALE